MLDHAHHSTRTAAPDQGLPSAAYPLFFSGGSGLNAIARELKQYNPHSVHLVTPFDSGGSSAEFRRAFAMPAVGDLRSRMLALADESRPEMVRIHAFFAHRLSTHDDAGQAPLRDELDLWRDTHLPALLSEPLIREQTAGYFDVALQHLPQDFDLRGACLGNLIVAGAYLHHERCLETASAQIGALLGTRGTVRCTANESRHLAAQLDDGQIVVGQHRITGKEMSALHTGIAKTWLTGSLDDQQPAPCAISPLNAQRITDATALIYAPGSFHSSLMAHFLPTGCADAIARQRGPKIYIPNLGVDPELRNRNPMQALEALLQRLQAAAPEDFAPNQVLDTILVDDSLREDFCSRSLKAWGISLHSAKLRAPHNAHYEPRALVTALLSQIEQASGTRLLG